MFLSKYAQLWISWGETRTCPASAGTWGHVTSVSQ